MSKRFFYLAFALGLALLAWAGVAFVGASWIARGMIAAIAAVYLAGAFELRRFRAATGHLSSALSALDEAPPALEPWLERVPAPLRNPVRARIEGERTGLPGPTLTPYLVGLLVMLGMLGTFLGMVVTFQGTVVALQGSGDLQAMRSALAEPIRGLGLAFGTSVAGVAASAMLGLMSALARRERLQVLRRLDACIAGVLQRFSLAQHRQQTLGALQAQARAWPEVVDTLRSLMERIEQRSGQLDEQLLQRQAQFQREVTQAYGGLAQTVGATLKDSLAAGAAAAGATIGPVVESAMTQVAQETQRLHARLGELAQVQADALAGNVRQSLDAIALAFEQRSAAMLEGFDASLARTQEQQAAAEQRRLQAWTETLAANSGQLQEQWRAGGAQLQEQWGRASGQLQEQWRIAGEHAARVLEQSQELTAARAGTEARWLAQHGERMDQLATLWRTELAALRDDEQQRGAAAVQRLGELEAAVGRHLASLGAALEAPIANLLRTAAEVPQAAAAVITQLREEMGRVAERDKLALEERTVLLEKLGALLQALQQASGEQRAAIDRMVESASALLEQAGARFGQTLDAHAGAAAEVAAQVAASAIDLASLAEGFGAGVQQFQASSEQLGETLQRVEAAIGKSTARSDEQLAYYVAQAREVIDLSIASQQGLVENLRQLQAPRPAKPAPAPAEEARA